ncbi:Protein of unknown function [Pyronema omphalodes CBS 100304]|uniref:Uncharacterized protein n=1 Tax=Pyronema omphalodes (strain CBS 100304) TaxID=1076935 RepID=U4LD86_PYROM|nr:Protein of unknown function [Pyronema omphalodes CBS 100304]
MSLPLPIPALMFTARLSTSTSPVLLFLGSIGVFTTYGIWNALKNSFEEREALLEQQRNEAEFKERYNVWVTAHRERYGGY